MKYRNKPVVTSDLMAHSDSTPDLRNIALGGWKPIETAPKDGRIISVRQGHFAPTRAFWKNGDWCHIQYHHSFRLTHWKEK